MDTKRSLEEWIEIAVYRLGLLYTVNKFIMEDSSTCPFCGFIGHAWMDRHMKIKHKEGCKLAEELE